MIYEVNGIDTPYCQDIANLINEKDIVLPPIIGGYIFNETKFKQPLNKAVNSLHSQVCKVITIWENGEPTSDSYFSREKTGGWDGLAAFDIALGMNQRSSAPIVFTVDYDAQNMDLIMRYFKDIRDVNSSEFLLAVYGSGLVCKTLYEAGLVHFTYLAMSSGWAGYTDWVNKADVVQLRLSDFAGIDCDEIFVRNPAVCW